MNRNGNLVSTVEEKAEVLGNFFASVFSGSLPPHPSPVDGLQGGDQKGKVPPTVREDHVCDHLRNLNLHKSMGADEMHPRVPRETQPRVLCPALELPAQEEHGSVGAGPGGHKDDPRAGAPLL